jgi:hypothetical protein
MNILVLPDSLPNPPETICHQHARSDEVHGWSEAASGEVALVLNGAVAAGRRHILRHGGRSLIAAQWVFKVCLRCGDVR